ncbi:glutamine--fructose-6-phosphate transaminase (isomerizing) [Muribaculaceae bacterium Isolate-039 (Harlan)]|jgi:glucosamine--fructose-6-phosphate aminotransferase (isomerizing)|uniref:glutamine--fructose-6-phosphate transaminase (isomerizing) n=1 Tax=Bacteroidales TaxID=171549 RepID=UPI000F477329|nr:MULTISPECIES: glutamine--fructose-6-phosphate transaminase (isomerizing) [Bacteroidales]ROS85378.1 glutamine--fructose-6-phosphate transaminase (isomerizing) [Muribaculaceae bacterium Isolate-039 (Harlan)]ROS93830.1 glutamine--fructose-6-phosphate transaminase (isomerizing) [Muribaculaceae bacterium Isolate-077 (Janvier)]ROS95899.1 glutamine--fructose-6-phosphate transaminase (isomerizing) [Muribaculaceae bacterium Isolate-083 (Janvier)]ROS97001.1 glutamine--fructose-6-phosphate transaminase
MCGIVGYIGHREAYPILINGLLRLEYRGYDSAGVALIDSRSNLNIYKSKGKVNDLESVCSSRNISGSVGIAHTRWATHGEPNDINAHPHVGNASNIAMVHNGTIENYAVLKEFLINNGYTFQSETDTEVLVCLIEHIHTSNNCSLYEATRQALQRVVGAFAIAVIDRRNPDTVICARRSSPLAIGLGDDEFFMASDASPIIEYTNRIIYLDDDQIAIIRRGTAIEVFNLDNEAVSPSVQQIDLDIAQLEKGGYPHFMLKEIMEQPATIRDCIRGRIYDNGTKIFLNGVNHFKEKFLNVNRIVIVACGTSWHASLIGKRMFQELAHIPVTVEYASEFRYGTSLLTPNDIVIAVSQSGETADTLAAIKMAHESGAFVYGICNVIGSSISREADTGTYIHVGPEIGVASTKAFTGQVTVLAMLAVAVGNLRGTISDAEVSQIATAISNLPELIGKTLNLNEKIEDLSKIYTYVHNFLYLGRGYNYPTALEGALKLKEISYIHAEGYPAAEMKHGPIALIDEMMPTVVIAPQDDLHDKIISNIQQVKARGGKVIAVINENDREISQIADDILEIPSVPDCISPIISSIPLQLLAYHIAIRKGCNVDMPRNLAKSVTVE